MCRPMQQQSAAARSQAGRHFLSSRLLLRPRKHISVVKVQVSFMCIAEYSRVGKALML